MSDVKIKICGLRRMQDVEYVNKYKPDFAGFVFAKSKRQVTAAQAAELKAQLLPQIKAVGVFVNAELDFIKQLADAKTIDIVQLHGDEDVAYCEQLRKLVKLPIIKVVRVQDESSFTGVESFPCDYLLFDTYTADAYGGTGKRFDMRLVDRLKITKPYFIAGGLDAANVVTVLENTEAFAVDVSGGVETDGYKDPQKIAAFIASVRGEEQ